MKILILLVFCLSMIACGKRGERIHNIKDLDQAQLNIVNNKFNIDITSFNLNTRSRRKIKPICRGIEGCLRVCEYFDKPKCKQLSIDKVLVFWMNQISMYTKWEQARNDLNLIATELEVSDFLSNVDEGNQVMEALFNLSISANCPINEQPNILFSYSPYVTLYLGAPVAADVEAAVAPEQAAADAAEVAAEADAGADMKVDCKPSIEFSPAGSDEERAAALAAQEKAQNCSGLVHVQFSSGGAEAATAKEALAAAEAEAATAKEALSVAEAAKGALAADTPQEEVDAADAIIAEAQAAVEAADAKVTEAQAAGAEVGAEPVVVAHADDGELAAEADIPQQQEIVSTKKKIMDGQVLHFNLPIFRGYIKKCFGYDTKTFSEMALEIENKKAFEMGDKVIAKACSENSECIRLSYCSIDSELVWDNLKPSAKKAGCDYEGFSEMLP